VSHENTLLLKDLYLILPIMLIVALVNFESRMCVLLSKLLQLHNIGGDVLSRCCINIKQLIV
jgi:hypothetical protein